MRVFLLLLVLAPGARAAVSPEALWNGAAALFDGMKFTPAQAGPMSLSELAQELAADPLKVDALVTALVSRLGKLGQTWDTPERRAQLAAALKAVDKAFLDRFPILTPPELLATASAFAASGAPAPTEPSPAEETLVLTGAPKDPAPDAFSVELFPGLRRGDQAALGKPSAYGDNLALARALNRLAAGQTVRYRGRRFHCVAKFLGFLRRHGTSIEVRSRRFYANFGDLRWQGRDVATPVYVDTGILLPSGRRLVVPVSHNQLEITLRGKVSADLSFYFGIDGSADFRADASLDQGWVGGRTVSSWSGRAAESLLVRAAEVRAQLKEKAAALKLPLGGYGPLGGCNDAHALVTSETPYPLLRDPRAFSGGSPLDAVSNALPYDAAAPADPRRVFEARPFEDPRDIPLAEVRAGMLELQSTLE